MEVSYRRDLIWKLREFNVNHLPVVEVGVAQGDFSRDMLKVWEVTKVYAVDAWRTLSAQPGDGSYEQAWHDENYAMTLEKFEPFKDKVVILRGMSTQMALKVPDDSVGFIYLDACHSYGCVTADLTAWLPKLVKGGIMAGHDFHNYDFNLVEKAVTDFVGNTYTVNRITETDTRDHSFWFQT